MRFYFRQAAGNLLRTYQFVLLRIAVGLVLAAGLVLTVVASAWLLLTFELAVAVPATLALLSLVILLSYAVGPYILYFVEAAHVAVLTELIVEGEAPTNQLRYGWSQVRANFASVTVLFVIDLAIRRVLRQLNAIINRLVSSLTEALAVGGGSREAGVVQGVVGIVQFALNVTTATSTRRCWRTSTAATPTTTGSPRRRASSSTRRPGSPSSPRRSSSRPSSTAH